MVSAVTSHDDSYEDLTECALSEELEEQLLQVQRECVFMWTNSKGEAFGVIMSMLPKDGKLWLTCAAARKRVPALRRFPRASICVTSTGTQIGTGKQLPTRGNVSSTMIVRPRTGFTPNSPDIFAAIRKRQRSFRSSWTRPTGSSSNSPRTTNSVLTPSSCGPAHPRSPKAERRPSLV